MSRIWSMMDIGKRSMMNSQTALQTVSHNIANKSTEGYSRQRVDVKANVPVGNGKLRIGMGAKASKVSRINNEYLERQIEGEGNKKGNAQARSETLHRVEQIFNEQTNKGLNLFMSEFFNAWRELGNNPESLAARTLVKERGDFLSKDFHRIHGQLTEIQSDVDFQITRHVQDINEITKEIADLNEKVQVVELNGIEANDERDRREQLVKELSEKINIRYAEGDDGQLTITAGNNAVIVSGYSQRNLIAQATPASEGKREGNIDIFYKPTKTGTPVNVTKQLNGGIIGGLLQVRDEAINERISDINRLAHTLTNEVNKAHTRGFDRYNSQGTNFFKPIDEVDAALKIQINAPILTDVGKIVSAGGPGGPGDNRIANVISQIQYKEVLEEGTSTIDAFYSSMVGKLGVEASRANSANESQDDIVKQLKNIRESISGVSLDEETAKMIEFQKNFDASARLIRTADEMMDTVLGLKR